MEYLIKANLVLIVFYLCYKFLLQKETFFQSNRWFLLLGLIIALVFPFILIPEYVIIEPINVSQEQIIINTPELTQVAINETETLSLTTLLYIIYGVGVAFFFIRFLLQFGSLLYLLLKNPKQKQGIYTYIVVKHPIAPFSFFKWIVYNPAQFNDKELQIILDHERAHVRQYHSVDIVISQLVHVIFWFNPVTWFYKKDLQQNLEYIADNEAQSFCNSEKDYQTLLLKTSVANYNTALTNSFYNSSIKKRIVMLHKSKTNAFKQWKIVLILPILSALLLSMNTQTVFIEQENTSITDTEKGKTLEFVVTKNSTDAELNNIIKEVENKGGSLKFSKITRNPKGELTGIFVSFYNHSYGGSGQSKPIESFIIYKELFDNEAGFVGRTNRATIHFKDIDKATDKDIEAIQRRVRKIIIEKGGQKLEELTPKKKKKPTQNGNKSYPSKTQASKNVKTKQATFLNQSDSIWVEIAALQLNNIDIRPNESKHFNLFSDQANKNPLYILDGKPVSAKKVQQLKQEDIAQVNVIKNPEAKKLYGDKAKYGVVIIITKKQVKINYNKTPNTNNSNNTNLNFNVPKEQLPLYIVDNEEVDQVTFQNLDNKDIQSINVIKDNAAREEYGKKGKNGVVIVRTKNNTSPIYMLDGKIITEAQVKKLEASNSIKNLNVIHHKKAYIKEKYNIETNGDLINIEVKGKQDKEPIYIYDDLKIIKELSKKRI